MQIKCAYDELLPIADLKTLFHPKNPNIHSEEQIDRLAKILNYQGARSPAKISKLTGLITAGHGRILAAEKLGWHSYPVNHQDYDTEEQEYADLVADNEIARWALPDLGSINAELGELGPDFDLDLLGRKDFVLEPLEKEIEIQEKELDENIPTEKECPSCGYKWERKAELIGQA